jgi:hypothetical protein
MTLDLEVNEVEVKVLTSLGSVTGSTGVSCGKPFWACKSGGREVGWGRAVAFDCTSQGKAAYGHVVYEVQEVSKRRQRAPKTAAIVPEMSVVL